MSCIKDGREQQNLKEEVMPWSRVGELGMEVALREIGCSEERISKALEMDSTHKGVFDLSNFKRRSHFRDASGPLTAGMSKRVESNEEGHVTLDDSEPECYTELERSKILATVGCGMSCLSKWSC